MWRFDQERATKSDSRLELASGDLPECSIHVEHAGSWRAKTAGSLQDKKYSLAFLLLGDWNSQLIPVTSNSPVQPILLKTDFSHSFLYPSINTFIPTKYIELTKRIFREKLLRKTRLIHPQSYTFDFPNSSTLSSSSLLYPWEDLKPNSYLTKFRIVRRFLVFGKQFKRDLIHIGWCNELIMGSGKLEKTRLGVTLLEQEAWRA